MKEYLKVKKIYLKKEEKCGINYQKKKKMII